MSLTRKPLMPMAVARRSRPRGWRPRRGRCGESPLAAEDEHDDHRDDEHQQEVVGGTGRG